MSTNREKKTISRRQFLFTTGGLIAGATLAACAPAAPAPAAKPAADAAKPAAEAPKATEAPKAAAPAPQPTVAVGEYGSGANPTVIWHGLGGADGAVFAQMLQDYAKKNNTAVRSEQYAGMCSFRNIPPP